MVAGATGRGINATGRETPRSTGPVVMRYTTSRHLPCTTRPLVGIYETGRGLPRTTRPVVGIYKTGRINTRKTGSVAQSKAASRVMARDPRPVVGVSRTGREYYYRVYDWSDIFVGPVVMTNLEDTTGRVLMYDRSYLVWQ